MAKLPIHVRLSGSGILPESVSAGELAEFIKETERALQETAKAGRGELPEGPLVSLTGLRAGSAELTFALDPVVSDSATKVTRAIARDRFDDLPAPAWEALSKISKQAVRQGWAVQFVPNGAVPLEPAVISADDEVPDPAPATAEGTTTVYGRCVRVGGVEPKAVIRLADGSVLYVTLPNEAMAKELAAGLYEEVGLEGWALWDTRGWGLLDFRVSRILGYRPGEAVQAFRDLAAAAGGRWDDVDPDEYVNRMRADEEA